MYQKNRFLKITLFLIKVFLESTEMVTRRGNHEVKSNGCGLRIEWDMKRRASERRLLFWAFQERKHRGWNRSMVRGKYQKVPRAGRIYCANEDPFSWDGKSRGEGKVLAPEVEVVSRRRGLARRQGEALCSVRGVCGLGVLLRGRWV